MKGIRLTGESWGAKLYPASVGGESRGLRTSRFAAAAKAAKEI
jgi:hypothetical protein